MVRLRVIEEYAKENHIPIMQKEGMEYLLHFIEEYNIKKILEIGSAIGYSAIRMAFIAKDIKITTIERDSVRYQEAVKNIHIFGLENQITIIHDDAFSVELQEEFDLIFIDAAKSQNIKFFEKFEPTLKKNGYIITDNLFFHGLTFQEEPIQSRNVRQMVRKIRAYISFLEDNKSFETTIVNVGDGLSISKKK